MGRLGMKRTLLPIFFVAICGTLLACGSSSGAEPLQARVHSQMPADHFVTKSVDLFIEEATKLSNGSIKFIHYPSQQLYQDKDIPNVLPKGAVEFAQLNGSMFVGKIPENGLASLPAVFDNLDHFYRYFMMTPFREVLDHAYQKNNMCILSSLLYSPDNCILSTKSITKIDDLRGKKIRTWGKILSIILDSWGASGVVMSSSDVYMAMERGTIDGVFSGLTSFSARKWQEVAKHVNEIEGFLAAPFTLAVNMDFWKKSVTSGKAGGLNSGTAQSD